MMYALLSPSHLIITVTCPVDLTVADPDGLTVDKQSTEISGAIYSEVDINSDSDPDDQIVIPDRKMGDYTITVIPELGAIPTETYTLDVSSADTIIVLAEDVLISNIPDQPYVIDSTEDGIFPSYIIPLSSGWNLISVPLNLTSWELGEEAVVGNPLPTAPPNNIGSIYRYNCSSDLFEKCDHFPDWGWYPATGSGSFTKLEPGRDYGVMANDCILTFTGTAPSDLDLPLCNGWNLIGWYSTNEAELGEEAKVGDPLNVTPKNSLTSIYQYNCSSGLFEKCDHFDNWGWYPATGSESFTELEPGRGYWVMAQNDCILTFTGTEPSDLDVTLRKDWNLIGWYSTNEAELRKESEVGDPLNVTPENSLTSIYRYNNSKGLFEKCDHFEDWGWYPATGSENFTTIEPGRGYWVMAENECVWRHEAKSYNNQK